MGVTWISCGGGDDVFCCVMDVESGCGLPWRMWMECVAMCVDGCVERVCPRELCGVRLGPRCACIRVIFYVSVCLCYAMECVAMGVVSSVVWRRESWSVVCSVEG